MADIRVKLDADRLRALALSVAEKCRKLWPEVKSTKGVLGALGMVPKVMGVVETTGKELGLLGEDKRAIVIQVICDLVPDTWVPDAVLEVLLGWAIERGLPALQARLRK